MFSAVDHFGALFGCVCEACRTRRMLSEEAARALPTVPLHTRVMSEDWLRAFSQDEIEATIPDYPNVTREIARS